VPKKSQIIPLALRSRPPGATLFRWLYDEIRTSIVEDRLTPGSRLPSTRSIASRYRVARGTVVAAFDQLAAEGYLEGNVGNGTFVRRTTLESLLDGRPARPHMRANSKRASLSIRGRRLISNPFPKLWSNRKVETFQLDSPALEAFPIKVWGRIAARRLQTGAPGLLTHGATLGFRPLREAVASHVALTRGVKCTADHVMITTGTQQSLDLIARLVLDPGDRAWVEDPAYAAATCLLRAVGSEVVGVPVDAEGINCDAGRLRCRLAKLAYVTPGCQFPLGVTMSLERRLALLRWAQEAGAWIFEDDYDSQLRFDGRPLSALHSLDGSGCVIYSNSFNKMLFSALRLGFLVVPPRLVDAVTAARSIIDRFPAVLDQVTLCDFISEGHMEQHMRRMRELYATRLDALVQSARRNLDGVMEVSPKHGGLQLVGWLAKDIEEDEACRRAAERGIDSVALSSLTIDREMPPALVLGVTSADVRAIRRGVKRLGHTLRELQARGAVSRTSAFQKTAGSR
jgi:GntR family transcriptional regulator / MocR family aminotransferase